MNLNKTLSLLFFVLVIIKSYSQHSNGELYAPLGKVNTSLPGTRSTIGLGIGVPAPDYTLDLQGEGGTYINLRPTGNTEYGQAGINIGDKIKIALIRVGRGNGDLSLGIDNPGRDINIGNNGGFDRLNFNIQGLYYGANWPKAKINFGGSVWMNDTLIVGKQYGTGAYTIPAGFGFGVGVKAQFNQFVGIGTKCTRIAADPRIMLAVGGSIWCEKLEIKLEGMNCWADYVFDKNYKLQSLQEVKRYITKNNHLPGIPSAKAIEKDGLAVEEMMKLQMLKIEELTLYVIQLQEEVEKLKGK